MFHGVQNIKDSKGKIIQYEAYFYKFYFTKFSGNKNIQQ